MICSIKALKYSKNVRNDVEAGNIEEAHLHSLLSHRYNTYATISWLIGLNILIIFVILAILAFFGSFP